MDDQQRYRDALAQYLVSEKDTRPYWETDHRGMVLPLVKSGYNNSVSYGLPGILGGSAPSILNDILQGRQVDKGEIEQAAGDAAGAAMTGSLAMTRPHGSVGSGGRRAVSANEDPTVKMHRSGDFEDWSSRIGLGFVAAERQLPSTDLSITSSWNGSRPGTGLQMYRALIDEANRKGLSVVSDFSVSPSAQHVYDALERRGHRVTRNPEVIKGVNDKLVSQNEAPVFDVGPSPWATYANAPTSAASPSLQHIAQTAAREQTTGIRAYHGASSPYDGDKYNPKKSQYGAFFAAESPDLANGFARLYGDAPRVYPVDIAPTAKLFDAAANPSDAAKLLAAYDKNPGLLEKTYLAGNETIKKWLASADSGMMEDKGVQKWLRKNGYDGWKFVDSAAPPSAGENRSAIGMLKPGHVYSATTGDLLYANAPTSAAAPSLQHIAKTAAREQTPGINAPRPNSQQIDQVWGPKFDILMGQQYRIAEAGSDLSTMYDILTAKLSKASGIDPATRSAMEQKVREIHAEMGHEWRRIAGIPDEVSFTANAPTAAASPLINYLLQYDERNR